MSEPLELFTDVLVLGGGPAATWAALKAAQAGADVVLADKGYCGTSGADRRRRHRRLVRRRPTPKPGRRRWPAARRSAATSPTGAGWSGCSTRPTSRVQRARHAGRYPFPVDEDGRPAAPRRAGPRVHAADAASWSAGPGCASSTTARSLELLVGRGRLGRGRGRAPAADRRAVPGARRRGGARHRRVRVPEPARSAANVDTGDGQLLGGRGRRRAVRHGVLQRLRDRPGVHLASPRPPTTPSPPSTARTARVLEGAGSQRGRSVIARDAAAREGVLPARPGRRRDAGRDAARRSRTSSSPFDRLGIDPFTQRFPVTLLLEGTVRGTGGMRVVDEDCATSVPGLYAAGRRGHPRADLRRVHRRRQPQRGVGDRRPARGPGRAPPARRRARPRRRPAARDTPRAGPGCGPPARPGARRATATSSPRCRARCCPYDKNYFRTATGLAASLAVLRRHVARGARRRCTARAPRRVRGAAGRGDGRARPVDVHRGAGPHRDPRHAQARGLPGAGPGPAAPAARRRARRDVDPTRVASTAVSPAIGPSSALARRAAMIEIVSRERCIACDRCVKVCPTQRVRRGRGRRPGDRPPGRLPDLLHVRGLLPGRRAVRRAADRPVPAGLAAARRGAPRRQPGCSAATAARSAGGGAVPRAPPFAVGPELRPHRRRSSPRRPAGPRSARESKTRSATR